MDSNASAILITGASSGIGKAIALRFAATAKAKICLSGRRQEALLVLAADICKMHSQPLPCAADLESDEEIERLAKAVEENFEALDILVHSAGVISQATVEQSDPVDLDRHYKVNLRAPYLLTRRLLPLLKRSQGQIVFINSSAGLTAPAKVSQYAASKHALKAFADSLRDEVNADGVRVLSVFLGRTATPMQAAVFGMEGRQYRPELLMQPDDIAFMVLNALQLPRTAEVTELKMRPFRKSY